MSASRREAPLLELRLQRALGDLESPFWREEALPLDASESPDAYEAAAAAVYLALARDTEPLPADLRRRIERDAHLCTGPGHAGRQP